MSDKDEKQEYWDDVRSMAESIQSELLDRVKEGESGESLREWLLENIHESIDSSARVIYTWKAKMCLVYSEHEGAYFEEFGSEGAVDGDCINWSALAFAAFQADVQDRLDSLGVDLNKPVPECEECGADDQDERKFVDGRFLCESCAEPKDEDTETEGN